MAMTAVKDFFVASFRRTCVLPFIVDLALCQTGPGEMCRRVRAPRFSSKYSLISEPPTISPVWVLESGIP